MIKNTKTQNDFVIENKLNNKIEKINGCKLINFVIDRLILMNNDEYSFSFFTFSDSIYFKIQNQYGSHIESGFMRNENVESSQSIKIKTENKKLMEV